MRDGDRGFIRSFDVTLEMRIRMIRRLTGHQNDLVKAKIPITTSGFGGAKNDKGEYERITPSLYTREELMCVRDYMHLPDTLDTHGVTSQIEISETFFLPTDAF